MIYSTLADLVVTFHLAYVLYVMAGQAAIVVGAVLGWKWIRHFWFRATHLLAIAVVAVENLVNFTCPLTTLEDWLRKMGGEETAGDTSFIGRLMRDILFYDIPDDHIGFTLAYVGFALFVLLTFYLVPPRLSAPAAEKEDVAECSQPVGVPVHEVSEDRRDLR